MNAVTQKLIMSPLGASSTQVDYFYAARRRRARWMALVLLVILAFGWGVYSLGIPWMGASGGPTRLAALIGEMWPPFPDTPHHALLFGRALAESVAIALLGTFVAAVLAYPVAFLAAKNVLPNAIVRFLIRRSLDTIRAVDVLIWALVWVSVVGLGPFAGILAIACADFGIFGKLFSEAIEVSDRGAMEGVRSTGGSRAHAVRYGLVPQVLPVIASQVLYIFESNIRSATIIGIVGAGGIGLALSEAIRTLEWRSVAFIVLMILVTVAVVDRISSRLRLGLIGKSGAGSLPS